MTGTGDGAARLDHPTSRRSSVRVLVVDDRPVVLAQVGRLVASQRDFQVVGAVRNGPQAVTLAWRLRPDIVLLGGWTPEQPGVATLHALHAIAGLPVILLTTGVDDTLQAEALRRGAQGVVRTDAGPQDLLRAVRSVLEGDYRTWQQPARAGKPGMLPPDTRLYPARTGVLTPRELQVLHQLVEGATNREIASALRIAEDTVKHHMTSLFDKTGASTRVELALLAVRRGIVAR